ncbi:hypothetical protein BGX23_008587 [Mortierella sp. AD031]|nr:hypothetical protein BGX23_008587 [Mortierella sp. AD031]
MPAYVLSEDHPNNSSGNTVTSSGFCRAHLHTLYTMKKAATMTMVLMEEQGAGRETDIMDRKKETEMVKDQEIQTRSKGRRQRR